MKWWWCCFKKNKINEKLIEHNRIRSISSLSTIDNNVYPNK